MKYTTSDRGFPSLEHPTYPPDSNGDPRIITHSSLASQPSLWFGFRHHLNPEQVQEVRDALTRWLETGDIRPPEMVANAIG